MIDSVEEHVYEHGFVILRTTSRRRIICMVHPNRAAALCAAILKAGGRAERAVDDLHTASVPAKAITD